MAIKLNSDFIFTQQSLSTFNTCPLKFKKRYIDGLRWEDYSDSGELDPLSLGNDFHILAKRYFQGIDTGLELSSGHDERLNRWMDSLKTRFPLNPDLSYYPEYKLVLIDGDLRLEANFDLLIAKEDGWEIWDWKTHSGLKRPGSGQSARLSGSLQTVVYLFVLGEKLQQLPGRQAGPERISMHYWQPEPQGVLAEVRCSSSLHERFRIQLEQNIRKIREFDYNRFDRSQSAKHCPFCEFRHLCGMQDLKAPDGQPEDIQDCNLY